MTNAQIKDYKEALKILQIEEDFENPVTIEIIKKKYRLSALMFHPDKNKSENAVEEFHKIQSAYDYLMKYFNEESIWKNDNTSDTDDAMHSYKDLLFNFLKNIVENEEISNKFIFVIFEKITKLCENKAFEFIEKIDKQLLIKIYDILHKYHHVFRISENLVHKIRKVLDEKLKNDSCIILHPTIDDLLDDKVYKLVVDDHFFWIPLWHHELVYDISGSDLYVRCFPILPDNIIITENNDIIIKQQYSIQSVLDQKHIEIYFYNKIFTYPSYLLLIKKTQKIFLKEKGIACINSDNIYDTAVRGRIIIEIELY